MTTTNGLYGVSSGYYPSYSQSAFGYQSASTPYLSFKGQLDSDTFQKKEGMGTGTKLLIAGLVIGGGILAHKAGWFGKLKNLFTRGAKEGAEQGAKEISKQTKEIADALPEVLKKQMAAQQKVRNEAFATCEAALKEAGVEANPALFAKLKKASTVEEMKKVLEEARTAYIKANPSVKIQKLNFAGENNAIMNWLHKTEAYNITRQPLRDFAEKSVVYSNAIAKRGNAYQAVELNDGKKLADILKDNPTAEKAIMDAVNRRGATAQSVTTVIKNECPDILKTADFKPGVIDAWIDASKIKAKKLTELQKANITTALKQAGETFETAYSRLPEAGKKAFDAEIAKGKSIPDAWETITYKYKGTAPTLDLTDILKISK